MGYLWELRSFELSSFIKPASVRWCHGIEMLLHYWPSERGIHRSLVDSLHKGPVIQSFDVFFNSQIASDLRHHDPHVACVTVMYDNLWHKPWYIHTHIYIYIYRIYCTNYNHVNVFGDTLHQSQPCACFLSYTVQSKPCSCFMRYTAPITTMCMFYEIYCTIKTMFMFYEIYCTNHNHVHVFWDTLHQSQPCACFLSYTVQSKPCSCFMRYTVPVTTMCTFYGIYCTNPPKCSTIFTAVCSWWAPAGLMASKSWRMGARSQGMAATPR